MYLAGLYSNVCSLDTFECKKVDLKKIYLVGIHWNIFIWDFFEFI